MCSFCADRIVAITRRCKRRDLWSTGVRVPLGAHKLKRPADAGLFNLLMLPRESKTGPSGGEGGRAVAVRSGGRAEAESLSAGDFRLTKACRCLIV